MKSEKVNAYSRSECSMCIESLNDRQCNHKLVSIWIGRRHLIYSSHFMCIRTHIPNIPGARTKRRKTIWFFFRIVFLPIPYLCLCGRDDTLHRKKNIRFYFPVKDLMSPVSYLLPISETPNTRPMENWEEPKLKQSIEKKKEKKEALNAFFQNFILLLSWFRGQVGNWCRSFVKLIELLHCGDDRYGSMT